MRKPKSETEQTRRITISLNKEIEKNLNELQKLMTFSAGRGWSMSKIINTLLFASILTPDRLYNNEWVIIKNFSDGKKIPPQEVKVDEYVANLIALQQGI